ncbi:MAG: bacteriohopanetetrol glucosamine biosynthesis glycosyltransferase HpnI [Acidobacteria bacterium]|nr:bacteriohopanetetrol glucosamine biosynthesis glycosyltransferase HpnI [Acidobacteriota bacterium]MBI3428326.1 bacteriohopanetetrol glucosamine biosynthesis glycosyltransferase HpnI [Acidobacteriota bacterium]
MKTFLLLCNLIVCSSLGELLSAKGMQQVGAVSLRPRALAGALWRMLRNPFLFAGVACLAGAFFTFISLLSYADLSFVVPLTAVSYITNTLGGRFFLHERISRERWLGTLLVAGGVALISLSSTVETHALQWWQAFYALLAPAAVVSQATAPLLFWLLFAVRVVLLVCVTAACVYYSVALLAGLFWFRDRRRQRALGLSYTPAATIFKPVRGADAHAYENFASFCRQNFPVFQIVFGVQDTSDPALPIIEKLQRDFPACDIALVVSPKEIGFNRKVSNLQNMLAAAKHEVLLLVDSDIRVGPDYLRRVVAPLQQPRVGMVTCLYRGTNATTLGGLLENIGISSTFGPEVCAARTLEGIKFALGSTIALKRALLEKIGGFPAVADYLADDFLLGNFTAAAGYEVVLSDYVVEHVTGPDSFGAMLRHQLRWGRSTRISRPWGYRGLILTYGTVTALLSLLAWQFSPFAWGLLALTLVIRALPAFVVGVLGLQDFVLARWFWLVPVRDLITFGVWLASFIGDEIHWRGTNFRVLPGGKLAPTGR